ncbi:putative P-loop containing nucleoside triphosphate hydrolase, leucine-rich repeat domain, L [Medicago truncatula]|uniref:Putative P-loop containing nucleoside triphosphate hydrolase, leucine-rich repeat domain, L n=1 Tax=Medicago truncatula TaxID=3880 RepID=A0A396INN4_MEDTR|nr:putative P-loop containing nucleoside triphosphate hydrolase, leucine-rich repeat domain, L [Medicago truncatula]
MDDYHVIYGRGNRFGFHELNNVNYEIGVSWKLLSEFANVSLVDESVIYGREHEKEEIINFLLSDSDSDNQVPIISIVGLIGIGKTTLAQLVYNDHRIVEQYELKAWVYLSESFDVLRLAQTILKSIHCSPREFSNDLIMLQRELQHMLRGKKYLLVLDGVRNIDGKIWEQLLLLFKCGSSGSKMIVTTRDKEVASIMRSTRLLHLYQLEESDSWRIFVNHAFRGRNLFDFPNLESVIKKVAEKCGGLPLALKTLGNLLRIRFSKLEWDQILETDLWCLSEGENNINPVLRLSFFNLPSDLKRCFAYCSIFPKGYEFEKSELIKLWMTEDLLKCCGRDKSEQELGNEFFDHLVSISFFLSMPLWDGKYYMHDLVNDLANSVSGEFCFRIEGENVQDISERTRNIWCCLDLKDGDRKLEHIHKVTGLRSLMVEAQGYGDQRFKISTNVQHNLFSRLKYLRMLSFSGCNLLELSDEIRNLKLLRYLDLSYTDIVSLPNSICMLYNLQTLLLEECFKLTKLPSDIYKLVNLRYLNLKGTHIKKMPTKIGALDKLEMLSDFFVGKQRGFDIKQLGKLNQLQGRLQISGLENVKKTAHAVAANLEDKEHLEELSMSYDGWRKMNGSVTKADVSVLEALQPNKNLMRLTIKDYGGSSFPNWVGYRHLPNLVSLELLGCKFCSQLPPLGQFPFLEKLSISGCDGIETIGTEFCGYNASSVPFRSLVTLRFEQMSEWKEWLCLEGFPLLQELCIKHCPNWRLQFPRLIISVS